MEIPISTDERVQVLDVTDRVADAVPAGATGTCTVFVPHTTAGVVVNEAEPRLLGDLTGALERWAPTGEGYAHDETDDNADAHLRATLVGEHVAVPVADGDLGLGTWQSVLFVECDGPRTRRVEVVVTESV